MEEEYDYPNFTDYGSYEDEPPFQSSLNIFESVVYSMLSVAGLVGDVIVIFLVATRPYLRNVTNVYILQRVLVDLVGTSLFPLGVMSRLGYLKWEDSIRFNVIKGLDYSTIFINEIFLILISIDCYLATRPRQNSLQHRWKVLKITSPMTWVCGLLYLAAISFSLDSMIHERLRSMYHHRFTDIQPFLTVYFSLIPLIICWIYVSFLFPVKAESVEANEGESVDIKAPPRVLVLALVIACTACHLPYYVWGLIRYSFYHRQFSVLVYSLLHLNSPVACYLCLFLQKDLRQALMQICQSRSSSNILLEDR